MLTDEELGRLIYEIADDKRAEVFPWPRIPDFVRESHINAAKAVRAALACPGHAEIDALNREIATLREWSEYALAQGGPELMLYMNEHDYDVIEHPGKKAVRNQWASAPGRLRTSAELRELWGKEAQP